MWRKANMVNCRTWLYLGASSLGEKQRPSQLRIPAVTNNNTSNIGADIMIYLLK